MIFMISQSIVAQNKKIDSLKIVLKTTKQDTTKLIALNDIAKESEKSQVDTSLAYYNKAKEFAEKIVVKYPKSSKEYKSAMLYLGKSINGIGLCFQLKGNYPKAIENYNLSLKIKEEIGDKKDIGMTLFYIGKTYKTLIDSRKAMDYFLKSLQVFELIKDKGGIMIITFEIASLFKDQGNIIKSIEFCNKSLKINEEIGDKEYNGQILNLLAVIYTMQGDLNLALNYFNKSLKSAEILNDKNSISQISSNIASVYVDKRDFENALKYYNRALDLAKEQNYFFAIAIISNNIGKIYLEQKKFELADVSFRNSLKLFEKLNDIRGEGNVFMSLGDLCFNKKNYLESIEFYNKAFKIFMEIGLPSRIKEITERLNVVHKLLGNHQLALENYELYIKMRDSINNIETQKAAITQNAKYEYEKQQAVAQAEFDKQQAITHLELQNKEALIDKNNQQLLVLEKDNELKELNLLQRSTELKQKQILSENQQKKLQLLDKEKKLSQIEAEKREADLKKQRILNYSLVAGVILVSLIMIFAIRGYQQKKKDNLIIQKQKKEVEEKSYLLEDKNHIIEEKQKEILDSINYAKRIQYTLLAHDEFLKKNLRENFTFFNPKDIVSGDFYWATKQNDKFYLAVCDSTGHGVPGAFMSLLNIGFLSEAINEKGIEKPNEVFDFVRMKLIETISKDGQKDGFDGILLCVDLKDNSITYAAANNSPILVQDGQIIQLPSDRMPVGLGERKENFSLHKIEAKSGDMLYLYTDGYADQFGGPKGKKFKYKPLNELLLASHQLPLSEQHSILKANFNSWKGNLEQVDDVCLIGLMV